MKWPCGRVDLPHGCWWEYGTLKRWRAGRRALVWTRRRAPPPLYREDPRIAEYLGCLTARRGYLSSDHNRETTAREKRRAEGGQRHYDEKEPALIHGICSRCAIEKLELSKMQKKSNYEDN